jgi:2-dehydro-3-deoxyphosphogluconate aldolase/(4S)-4-hydroxy-2-oxoglutarate aldolase
VVAIGRWFNPADVEAIAAALVAGGIRALEITSNSHGAMKLIEAVRKSYSPDRLLIGAGTILDIATGEEAISAGASFIVSPHTDPELVGWAANRGIPAFPGAGTMTEALTGWRAGAAGIKIFPASVLGAAFVRELKGPFPDITVIPTGGISAENAAAMLAAGKVVALGVGSWLTGGADPEVVRARALELVTALESVPHRQPVG